ncbi:hypothetical protein M9458_033080 [Cirrhinus mrigala]|uniref:ribonuclease H n=1 Tax=Cirrhinus mrigala TaxID=683832 RepID=A0ABD0PFC0_CIRMR
MEEIFWDMLHKFVVVYIDDILIYSCILSKHHRHVIQVLQHLREYNLFLKLEKWEFLGYLLTPEGVYMGQGKVLAVQNWPKPNNIKELQRFLRFANFYQLFITDYSQLSAPLPPLPKTQVYVLDT